MVAGTWVVALPAVLAHLGISLLATACTAALVGARHAALARLVAAMTGASPALCRPSLPVAQWVLTLSTVLSTVTGVILLAWCSQLRLMATPLGALSSILFGGVHAIVFDPLVVAVQMAVVEAARLALTAAAFWGGDGRGGPGGGSDAGWGYGLGGGGNIDGDAGGGGGGGWAGGPHALELFVALPLLVALAQAQVCVWGRG